MKALKEAGKWNEDAKHVLTCGCGKEFHSVRAIAVHGGRNEKCKKKYWEKCGVRAFSGEEKYEFLRNPAWLKKK